MLVIIVDNQDTTQESAMKEMLTKGCEISRMVNASSAVNVVIKSLIVQRMEAKVAVEEEDAEADLVHYPTHQDLDQGVHQDEKDDKSLTAGQAQKVIDPDHQDIEEEEEEVIVSTNKINQDHIQDHVLLKKAEYQILPVKEKIFSKDSPQDLLNIHQDLTDPIQDHALRHQIRKLVLLMIEDRDHPQYQTIIDLKRQIRDPNLYQKITMLPQLAIATLISNIQISLTNRKWDSKSLRRHSDDNENSIEELSLK